MPVLRDSSLNPPVTVSVSPGPAQSKGQETGDRRGEASRGSDIGAGLSRVPVICQMDGEDAPVKGVEYRSQSSGKWLG